MSQLFFLLLIISVAAISFAQDITGNLEGLISDSLGSSLPGVNVTCQSENLQGIKGTATNERGYFHILFLPVGNYIVKISMIGFRELIIENVLIRLGKTTYIGEIKLVQAAINLSEITVSGERLIMDPASTVYGGNLIAKDFENLPVDRNYQNMISLLPQANLSFYGDGVNIAGATGNENKYFVDGVEVTDPMFGNSATNLPYNFIKEIGVKTGGYEAEYRSSLGGIINVVTNTGSNEFNGSAFGFYTNNNFSSNTHFGALDPLQGKFSDYDIGFSIGGPFIKDVLWFYVAYNPSFIRKKVNVPGFGDKIDNNITHSFASKISWRINDKIKINFTGTGDPTYRNAVGNVQGIPLSMNNIDPYLTNEVNGGINLSINGTYLYNDNLLFELFYSNTERYYIVEPATEQGKNEILFIDNKAGTWSGGVDFKTNESRFVNSLHFATSLILNNHRFKTGFEYKDNANFIKETDSHTIKRFNDTLYSEYHFNNSNITVHNHIPALFIQDSWQIFSNLNLNLGLRLEGQFLVGSNNKVDQRILGPVQPRIGFVYLPDKDGFSKIFGSFGRFTQDLSTLFLLLNYSENGYRFNKSYSHDPRIDSSGGFYDYYTKFSISPEINGLQPQYFDEFSFGYEQIFSNYLRVKLEGTYRIVKETIEDMWIAEEGKWRSGNPGTGEFSNFPKPKREYSAISISTELRQIEKLTLIGSYVLSRNYGNYPGLFDAYKHSALPNRGFAFNDANENTIGLLPNDVTHVFKLNAYYSFLNAFIAGISFTAQSGTPLNEYVSYPIGIKFLKPRGNAGRTSAIWDLNLRLSYEFDLYTFSNVKLLFDAYHIASQHKPVDINQAKGYLDTNGNFSPYATFGQVLRYQQPMSFRLGMEINF